MPRIEWKEEFSVSHREIDEQHKGWIAIINELHETLMTGQSQDLNRITHQTFKKMEDYVKGHFAFEEEFMRSLDYPDFEAHHQEHQDFMARVIKYRQDFESGVMALNSDIMKMLTNWLQNHILESDKRYSLFAAKQTD